MDTFRVWAEIDLDALAHNLQVIRRHAGAGVRIMLIVKADAYGHGAVAVAHHAVRCGIGAVGVGTSGEALELRQAGIRVPVLVLGTVLDEEVPACLRNGVHLGLHSSDRRASLQERAASRGLVAKVHLNVDTGMGRLGVLPARALDLIEEVYASSHVELCGLMTHISSPDGALDPTSRQQMTVFDSIVAAVRERHAFKGWVHASNSASVFTGLAPGYDTVRPGIAAYGALPQHLPGASELQPVMSFRSQIVFLKDVPPGTSIGYGSTWRAPRTTRIATLAAGYNDGIAARLGGRGEVLVRGRRAPIVGRVSMDYTTIDVGHIPGVRVGDAATIVGRDGDQEIRLQELAHKLDTIPYEVTCSIGKRVARSYRGGENVPIPGQPSSAMPPVPILTAGSTPTAAPAGVPAPARDR